MAESLGKIEGDRDRHHVILARQRHQGLARLQLHIGCVNHREPPRRQPLARDEVQHLKRFLGRALVVLVV